MSSKITLLIISCASVVNGWTQCGGAINSFPYMEGFELSDGGWVSGGSGNDWAWGTPSKPVITAAGGGSKCWVIGGLMGSTYTNAEASWIQSPCFDFSGLQYPYVEFKVFWEMEQQFDGASLQYSIDNGSTWINVGAVSNAKNCLNNNWFNYGPINFLAPLSSVRDGWSGNKQSTAGSCKGGNGSNGWVTANHTMPYLAGKPGVLFRFIFGAGTICNNYDGFAVDDFMIGEAPANAASFSYSCINNKTVSFTNTSANCPTGFNWDFGDPTSGSNNTSTSANPTHDYATPGQYTVTLTVTGPGNAPSTITKNIIVLDVSITMLSPADCQTNLGGSLRADVTGAPEPFGYAWSTSPVQTGLTATNLAQGTYFFTVTGTDVCTAIATGTVDPDFSCIGIYFPTAFTPNNNGKNDRFGPLGSIASLTQYRLVIFNRWGQQVFSSVNPFEKWIGEVGGTRADGNIFVWYAEYYLQGKGKESRKGIISLIR